MGSNLAAFLVQKTKCDCIAFSGRFLYIVAMWLYCGDSDTYLELPELHSRKGKYVVIGETDGWSFLGITNNPRLWVLRRNRSSRYDHALRDRTGAPKRMDRLAVSVLIRADGWRDAKRAIHGMVATQQAWPMRAEGPLEVYMRAMEAVLERQAVS